MTYKNQLLDPRWQKKRLEILNRDEFMCQICGSIDKTLHVHHFSYKSKYIWETPDDALCALCCDCHEVLHIKKLTPLEKEIIESVMLVGQIREGLNQPTNILVKLIVGIVLSHKRLNNG